MAVTIKDIAKAAGVSLTTVSRVINNKTEGMSQETRKKILELIENMGYRPNAIARGLVTKRTRTLGLIVPDISNPFFPDLAKGVEDYANSADYTVFLCNTYDDQKKEEDYIRTLTEKSVDGIIFATGSQSGDDFLERLAKGGKPLVVMNKRTDIKSYYGVMLDDFEGGYMAAKHLISLGHKRIGCITGSGSRSSAADRLNGYKKALSDFGIPLDEKIILPGNYMANKGKDLMEKLLDLKEAGDDITAVFISNDLMASGAYKALKERHYNIPGAISIVGFDDINLASMMDPELTTMRQPAYSMGYEAGRMLVKLIEGRRVSPRVMTFKPELIERKSTGTVKEDK